MNREEILELFPDASEEQIEKLLEKAGAEQASASQPQEPAPAPEQSQVQSQDTQVQSQDTQVQSQVPQPAMEDKHGTRNGIIAIVVVAIIAALLGAGLYMLNKWNDERIKEEITEAFFSQQRGTSITNNEEAFEDKQEIDDSDEYKDLKEYYRLVAEEIIKKELPDPDSAVFDDFATYTGGSALAVGGRVWIDGDSSEDPYIFSILFYTDMNGELTYTMQFDYLD